MTPENTQKLFDAFPHLYRGRAKPLQDSSMALGFQCEDGWFDLIWNLSLAIEEAVRREGIEPQSDVWPEASQVKQKFGTLRFHLENGSEAMSAFTGEAEQASAKICEVCGTPGLTVSNRRRYVKTLCSSHAEEFLQQTGGASRVEDPVARALAWKLLKTDDSTMV